MRSMDYVRVTKDMPDLDKVMDIYESSFPEKERASIDELINGYDSKTSRFEAVYLKGEITSIVFTVSDSRIVFLYYLATKEKCRSKGIGGRILDELCARSNLPMILNVEHVDQSFEDYEIRKRRYDFYIRHGFSDTGRVLSDEQGTFNVLCKGKFDESHYLDFLNSFGGETCIYL